MRRAREESTLRIVSNGSLTTDWDVLLRAASPKQKRECFAGLLVDLARTRRALKRDDLPPAKRSELVGGETQLYIVLRDVLAAAHVEDHFGEALLLASLRTAPLMTGWLLLRGLLRPASRVASVRGRAIARAPGSAMLAISRWLLSPRTRERVIEPMVADMRFEYYAALQAQEYSFARIVRIRWLIAFTGLLIAQLPMRTLLRWLGLSIATGGSKSP